MSRAMEWAKRSGGRRVASKVVLLLAVAVFAASCSSDSSEVSEVDEHKPEDLAHCFAFSIDQVGRGNVDAGIERFDECLADDYTFEFQFFEGGPSIVCPSAECPVQEFSSPGDLRARFATNFFVPSGYMATQHQILNIDVDQNGDAADVFAYIQANHFLPDNSVDIAWNDYSFNAVRSGDRWLIQDEVIVGTAFLNFQGAPVG